MRRTDVRRVLALAACALVPGAVTPAGISSQEPGPPGPAAPADSLAGPFRLVEVAPGVLAAVLRPDVPSYAFANSLVVVGSRGVLVVDTQQDPAAARALLGAVRARTDVPVRWVVNTHAHGDHVWGNQVYRDAFPGVAIVAHRATRAFLLDQGPAEVVKQKEAVEESIELRRGWLASGTGPGGESLTEADRESLHGSLAIRTAYLQELDSLRLVVPDVTFDDAMEIDLGDRIVRLMHVGPAHSPGDVVVYLPDSRVLAAGDVVEEGALWLEGADVRGWARALERLRRLELSAVLPGHGTLVLGRSILDVQGGFLDAVVAWAGTGGTGRGASGGAAGTSPAVCADPGVPLPSDVAVYREAFASWGVDEEAFERMAREACGSLSVP